MTVGGFFAIVFAVALGNIISEALFIFLATGSDTDPKSHDDWER